MAIDWTSADGDRIVPAVLVHGMGVILVPAGVTVTGITIASVDAAWWPGTGATHVGLARAWLDLSGGLSWSERAEPLDPDALEIGSVRVVLSDVDQDATELFSARESVLGSYLTAEVSATAVTVPVISTTGFAAAPAVMYLGREAIHYTGTTATSFTGCTRGYYGSRAQRHPYSPGDGSDLMRVTAAPLDLFGRPATVWMVQLDTAGVITQADLQYYGSVGSAELLDAGSDGWVLPIDHVSKRLRQAMRSRQVTVGGYAHNETPDFRTSTPVGFGWGRAPSGLRMYGQSPLVVLVEDGAGAPIHAIALTRAAASPDNGGWHPTKESFVGAFQTALSGVLTGAQNGQVALEAGGHVRFRATLSAARFTIVTAPWSSTGGYSDGAVTTSPRWRSPDPMPDAWVPLGSAHRMYFSPRDWALLPAPPAVPSTATANRRTAVFWTLNFTPRGGIQGSLLIDVAVALERSVRRFVYTERTSPYVFGYLQGTTRRHPHIILTEPTVARVGAHVITEHWVQGLRDLLSAIDTDLGDALSGAFDWDQMIATVDRYSGVFSARRDLYVDLDKSLWDMLANEARLGGFVVTVRRGRIALARVADFSRAELQVGSPVTLSTNDLDRGEPVPSVTRASDVVNTVKITLPGGTQVVVTDQVSLDLYGQGRGVLEAEAAPGFIPPDAAAEALYVAIYAQAMTVLGPTRRPEERIGMRTPIHRWDLPVGDVVSLTSLWRVPNHAGGRGLTSRVAQVLSRSPSLYQEGMGHVALVLRLSPAGLTGWAPSALVKAGGITGAVLTLDDTTWGTTGSGQSFPADGFVVGDKVRLIEIDSRTPTAATQHTVTVRTNTTLTLDPAPSAGFATLAASALKVLVTTDDWTTPVTVAQGVWCFLATRPTYSLDASTSAQVFAA